MDSLGSKLLTLFAFMQASLMALPMGNPAEGALYLRGACSGWTCSEPCLVEFCYRDILRLKGGFYGDYVYNRHMEVYRFKDNESDIDQFTLFTNAGYLAVNLLDWIDVYGLAGTTKIDLTTTGSAFSTNEALISLDYQTYLSWGLGTSIVLFQKGCFYVGFEGQYFRTVPRLNSILRYQSGNQLYFGPPNKMAYDEWQVGLGAAYSFENPWFSMTPYIGIKRARGEMVLDDFSFSFEGVAYTLKNLKSKKLWGYAVGTSAILWQMIGVTVEGRFADEKALYVNAQLRY